MKTDSRQQSAVQLMLSSERFFREAFDCAGTAMALIGKDQAILKANKLCCELLGYSSTELYGVKANKFAQRRNLQQESECFSIFIGSRDHLEQRRALQHKSGRTIWVRLVLASVRDEAGEVDFVIASLHELGSEYQKADEPVFSDTHDSLTSLFNRPSFLSHLDSVLVESGSTGQKHVLCCVDIDQFKLINDTLGHAAGDQLLHQVALLLRNKMRRSDVLGRLGGDEFGILMVECSVANAQSKLAELLSAIAEARFVWQDRNLSITVSVGLAMVDTDKPNVSSSELVKQAEIACYAAKQSGRNRIQQFRHDDERLIRLHDEMLWIPRIQAALRENRFVLYAQEIIATGTRLNSYHCELLLRYRSPDGELVSPQEFMPAAERYNMSPAIDLWVMQEVLRKLAAAHAEDRDVAGVYGVNISGLSLGDPHFHERMISLVRDNPVTGVRLCFEITETAVIANLQAALNFIKSMRELGCQFALDDFGNGLSSFAYLRQLPVEYLKIDGSFVRGCLTETVNLAIINAVNKIARVMDISTIAESIESAEIFLTLSNIGIDYAQGYWISPPEPWLAE